MTLYSKHKITNVSIPLYVSLEDVISAENHSMFRIILIESGTGILRVNDGYFVFMSPSIFCLNEKDAIVLEKQCDVRAQVIYFDPVLINSSFEIDKVYDIKNFEKFSNIQDYFYLQPFLTRSEKSNFHFEVGLALYKRITQLYKMIYEQTNPCQDEYWVCHSRSFFLEILIIIQSLYTSHHDYDSIQLPSESKDLNEVILYLHENYQNSITIEYLTKIFHVNRTTLSERFRASTGMSIKDYLIKLRVKLSAAMLRDTMLPISEIMRRVGFNEANHFSRIFKKYMTCSPSDYRKKFYT